MNRPEADERGYQAGDGAKVALAMKTATRLDMAWRAFLLACLCPEGQAVRDHRRVIEAEAVAAERERVRAALTDDKMRAVLIVPPPPSDFAGYENAVRDRLLAIIEPKP